MKLICLPYAGGSGAIFYKWKEKLSPSIELINIELKGRGWRCGEEFYENIYEAVSDIYKQIQEEIDDDYAILGHSMGSLLAYELYYFIEKANAKKPKHIFFMGLAAPNLIKHEKIIHELDDIEFIKEVKELGGINETVMENRELIEFFIPIIKNDIRIFENYKYIDKRDKICCDISVLNGKDDCITIEEILGWQKHTSRKCKMYMVNGNHFFINDYLDEVAQLINNIVSAFNSNI